MAESIFTTETLRMKRVQTPVIPVVGELVRSCPGTISLGQGVVHYGPPETVSQRLAECFADPENHKYRAVEGIAPLLEALEVKLREENKILVRPRSRLLVTAGGNMAFMNAVLGITDPGDEVILPVPYYFNHDMAICMAGCTTIPVPTDENYQPIPEAIEEAISPKTRAVVTVSPNNPTGVVYSEGTLRAINELCRQHGIYHIHDEAYEYFTYDGAQHFSPASFKQSQEFTISLFSLSKAYGFAGWRIGYMVIPEHLFVSIKKIQDTILICPPVASQYAALGALDAGPAYCKEKLKGIERVRLMVLQELGSIADICTVPAAGGAFYFLIQVHSDAPPMRMVEQLIRQYRVAVMPGSAFGLARGCSLRVAYGALEESTASEAISRLVRGLRAIVRT